jgi:hypothetical protein
MELHLCGAWSGAGPLCLCTCTCTGFQFARGEGDVEVPLHWFAYAATVVNSILHCVPHICTVTLLGAAAEKTDEGAVAAGPDPL